MKSNVREILANGSGQGNGYFTQGNYLQKKEK